MKTEKILIFQGGGYDGCFWEWNAILFTEFGSIAESIVSGRTGNHAVKMVQELGPFKAVRELARDARRETSKPLIIRTDKDWEYFCKEWNSGFVRGIAQAAGRGVRCDNCGHFFCPDEIVHTGYRGDGGIGISYTDNKCRECADNEHYDYVVKEWPRLRLAERVEAIQKAKRDGCDVSIFAARRDEFPAIWAEHVYEPEYY